MEKEKKKISSYKDLLTEKEFLKNMLSTTIGRLGDSIDSIAFAWLVYQITGSKTWLAIIWGVNTIPSIIFQPLVGPIIDNLNKKKVIVFCEFFRGINVLITAVLMYFKLISPLYLVIFTFLNSSLEAFRIPAGLAILPKLLSKDKYSHGIALRSTISRFAELVGLGIAGFIIGATGISITLIVDASMFILCSIIMTTVRYNDNIVKIKMDFKSYFHNLKDGFEYFKSKDVLFTICIFGCIIGAISLPVSSLQAAYVNESLSLGVEAISLSGVLITLGMFLGTAVYPYISKRVSNRRIFLLSWVATGLFYFSLVGLSYISGEINRYIGYGVSSLVFGFIASLLNMMVSVLFVSSVEEEYMGRAGGIFNSLASTSLPLASFAVATISPFLTVNQIYVIFGVLAIIIFTVSIRLKVLRKI